ncbi:MAG: ABC transporter substrate-binding protein [Chloroflexota bacterium]
MGFNSAEDSSLTRRMLSRRDLLKAAGLVAGSAVLAACSSTASQPAATQAPATGSPAAKPTGKIKIGTLNPGTGTYAVQGVNAVNGGRLAIAEYNDAGGVLNSEIEYIWEDSQANAGVGTQKAQKLIDKDKVNALTGEVSTSVALAVGEVAEAAKVLYVASAPNGNEVTGKNCRKYVFRVDSMNEMGIKSVFPVMITKGKNWYFITHDYAWGQDGYRIGSKMLKDAGGNELGNILVPLGTNDFSSHLIKVRDAKPDVLFVTVGGSDFGALLKQLKEFGLQDKMQLTGPIANQSDFWSLGIDYTVGYWPMVWYYQLDVPGSQAFNKKYMEKYGQPAENNSWQEYIAVKSILEAMKKANSVKGADLVKALEGYEFDGLKARKIYYREWDHQLVQEMYVLQAKTKDKMKDNWDYFDIVSAAPKPDQPLDAFAGTKETVGCNMPGA